MLNNVRKKLNRTQLLGLLLCITIIAALTDLAFSVRTYHDMIIFGIMVISFIYNIISDLKQDKKLFTIKLKEMLVGNTKWLFIALACYYAYDLITIIYAKDIMHALKKLPYMLEYTTIFLCAIYYLGKTYSDKQSQARSFKQVLFSIGISGVIVSICSYFYYAFSLKPIYFQRLSTARDYNVYACLILFTSIVLLHLIVNLLNVSYIKRLLLFVAVLIVNLPTFYFAGSRRMFIMLPYFFVFFVIYEFIMLILKCYKSVKIKQEDKISFNFLRVVTLFVVTVVLYFGCIQLLPTFTNIGTEKEAFYNKVLKENVDTGKKPIGNGNASSESSEKTISNVLETIDDKSMFNKRSIIYNTAFEELQDYSIVNWIFGRGSAYDIHMYDVTDNEKLLTAYSIDENNPRPRGWMSAHNFMIADLLNGGVLKLILGFFVVIQLVAHIIKAIKVRNTNALLLVVPASLVIINNFISGAYGVLNDLFFYSTLIMIFSVLNVNNSALYRKEDKKCLTN